MTKRHSKSRTFQTTAVVAETELDPHRWYTWLLQGPAASPGLQGDTMCIRDTASFPGCGARRLYDVTTRRSHTTVPHFQARSTEHAFIPKKMHVIILNGKIIDALQQNRISIALTGCDECRLYQGYSSLSIVGTSNTLEETDYASIRGLHYW